MPSKTEENSTENETESKALKVKEGNEVLLLQDSLLSLTVSPPNAKSFEVQVSILQSWSIIVMVRF